MRTLFDAKDSEKPDKKLKLVMPFKKKEEKEEPEKPNEDHLMIKSILWDNLKLTSAYRVTVTSIDNKKVEADGVTRIVPTFRVNVWTNDLSFDHVHPHIWKSFWVRKEGGKFIFTPKFNKPQSLRVRQGNY